MQIANEVENILLIVDDEPDIRILIKHIFQDQYTVLSAEDGAQGIAMALEHVPNIIISDVMMPNVDGFELCKQLKNNEHTSHIPIILLTAKADQVSKLEGLQLGATDYISKPFLIDELKSKVTNLVTQQNNVFKYLASKVLELNDKGANNELDKLVSVEEQFLHKANGILEVNYSNQLFDVEFFAKELYLSSQQLRRKLKAITNITVVEFIRNYRMQKAEVMIKRNVGTISEIAYAVGYDSVSYFSRVFQDKYAMSPSEYKNKL